MFRLPRCRDPLGEAPLVAAAGRRCIVLPFRRPYLMFGINTVEIMKGSVGLMTNEFPELNRERGVSRREFVQTIIVSGAALLPGISDVIFAAHSSTPTKMGSREIMNRRIRGALAPVVTPFQADLSPDRRRFIAHCKWLLSQNCGLAVFGTNSEANSLSMEERAMLLEELVAAGVDPSRMVPGTGCCSIMETIKLTAQAVEHGCAGVLMLPPFYYKDVGEEGLYRYFSEVVQRVGDARLKIYLYHIPPVAVVGITTGLVERLLPLLFPLLVLVTVAMLFFARRAQVS